jgi:uroporphyrinogen decarboxylase
MDPASPERRESWEPFVEGRVIEPPSVGTANSGGFSASLAPEAGMPTCFRSMGPTYWFIVWAGFENAAVMIYEEPQLVEEIYEHITWFITSQMETVFSRRIPDVVILTEEGCFKGGPFMSPDMYRELVCPKIRRIADVCIKAGVPFVFVESEGDVTSLVPLWMEAGINGVMPLDVTAGTDPVAIRKQYPDLALIGGIDRTALTAGRERIRHEIENRARVLFLKGKCIPSVDGHGAVREDVSFDNIRFYAECLHREAFDRLSGNTV